jgi:GT2 family glycosyltransferase
MGLPMRGSVDAVVTAFTTIDRLGLCLGALRRQLPEDATITLADAIPVQLSPLHTELARIAREENLRLDRSGRDRWEARNRAAQHGQAPLILFVDADAILAEGAWVALAAAMEPETVGAVGGLAVWDIDCQPPGYPCPSIRSAGYVVGAMMQPYVRFPGWSPDNPKIYPRQDLQGVPVNFMATRRSLFRTLGPFPSDPFGNRPFADMYYCLQLRKAGLAVAFDPAAIAVVGREPIALSRIEVNEGQLILSHQAGDLLQYDEPFLL